MILRLLAPWYRPIDGQLQDERLKRITEHRREVAEHAGNVAMRVEEATFSARRVAVRL